MTFLADLRLALRSLLRTPGFAASVVVILALGIGTVTAVFTTLDRVMLRPLPAESPERWVHLVRAGTDGSVGYDLSYPAYRELRDHSGAFDAVVAHTSLNLSVGNFGGASDVERVEAAAVSAGALRALGIALPIGRDIAPDEDRVGGAQKVVVIGFGLWQRRFGGDPAVVGHSVRLNGEPYTVIGVAPANFLGMVRGVKEEAWIPLTSTNTAGENAFERGTVSWLGVLARLAPGVSRAQAYDELGPESESLVQQTYLRRDTRLGIEDGEQGFTGMVGDLSRPLTVLLVASVLVLVIACANLASLWLARATARRRQLVIRLALGATRGALARLLLAEALLLSIVGGAGGLLVAQWLGVAAPTLRSLLGAQLELGGGVDLRMLGFVAIAAVSAALIIALGPALWTSGLRIAGALRELPERRLMSARGALVVLQVALAVVLVSGASLLSVTSRRLAEVSAGYDPSGVLAAGVDLEAAGDSTLDVRSFWERTLERLDGSAPVAAASVVLTLTPSPGGMNYGGVPLEGVSVPADDISFDVNLVGTGYFETLSIPVLTGRDFERSDRRGAQRVAVINRAMARRYWGDASPVGRNMWLNGDSTTPATTIIGVVGDGKYRSLRESPQPMVYLPALQVPPVTGTLLVRAKPGIPLEALAPLVRQAVREIEPRVPVYGVEPLADHLALAHATERLLAFLATVYAALATLLAAVGLFGLLSYTVVRRTREIGIRVALGAEPGAIRRLVLRQGLARTAVGLGLGLGIAAGLGRLIQSLLFGVAPLDPVVLAGVTGLILAMAVLACWWPASRAAAVDPVVALRSE